MLSLLTDCYPIINGLMGFFMFGFSFIEVRDLVISAVVLAFLFAYPFTGCAGLTCYAANMLLFLLLVSTAFIGHELSHRMVARHFGCYAEFQMWPTALLFAAGLRILLPGFPVFAAPGAVMFSPFSRKKFMIGNKEVGMIGLAGPLANVALALLFYLLMPGELGIAGAYINLSLAMFNMWPIGPLDGAKVFRWNLPIWGIAFLSMFLLQWGLG